jgi:putative ABC transport system ATP-binding protein
MLEISNITKKYRKGESIFTALEEFSLKVDKGDFIAVLGSSGSGKSTLLHTIGGLIKPDSGKVSFNGKNIYEMKQSESDLFRKRNIGFVFQQFHLIPYLSVYENILAVCTNQNEKARIDGLLNTFSLIALKNKYPSELSVGEKQRTAFIRAIITHPDILLADEPTGNLDPENSRILMSMISDFHKQGGTVFLVSHDPESTKYATRKIRLQSGKLV